MASRSQPRCTQAVADPTELHFDPNPRDPAVAVTAEHAGRAGLSGELVLLDGFGFDAQPLAILRSHAEQIGPDSDTAIYGRLLLQLRVTIS